MYTAASLLNANTPAAAAVYGGVNLYTYLRAHVCTRARVALRTMV